MLKKFNCINISSSNIDHHLSIAHVDQDVSSIENMSIFHFFAKATILNMMIKEILSCANTDLDKKSLSLTNRRNRNSHIPSLGKWNRFLKTTKARRTRSTDL